MRITQEYLKEVVHCDKDTGILVWRDDRAVKAKMNNRAGTIGQNGYNTVQIDLQLYRADKLVWLYVYGEWPEHLWHVNGVKADDRLCNLRLATFEEIMRLHREAKNLEVGKFSIAWNKDRRKWEILHKKPGKRVKAVGAYDTFAEAQEQLPSVKEALKPPS